MDDFAPYDIFAEYTDWLATLEPAKLEQQNIRFARFYEECRDDHSRPQTKKRSGGRPPNPKRYKQRLEATMLYLERRDCVAAVKADERRRQVPIADRFRESREESARLIGRHRNFDKDETDVLVNIALGDNSRYIKDARSELEKPSTDRDAISKAAASL